MKRGVYLLLFAVAGCSLPGTPTATTGWKFEIGSPSLVHVPVINSQTTGDVSTTTLGTHVPQEAPMPQAASNRGGSGLLPPPIVLKPTRGGCNPCDQE